MGEWLEEIVNVVSADWGWGAPCEHEQDSGYCLQRDHRWPCIVSSHSFRSLLGPVTAPKISEIDFPPRDFIFK